MKITKTIYVFILSISLILSSVNMVLADTSNAETNASVNTASVEEKESDQAVSPVLALFTIGTAVLLGGNVLLKRIKNPSKTRKSTKK